MEDWPVHPNSDRIIEAIGKDKPFRQNRDMGFVLVPPSQKKVDVKIVNYPDESDPGPFPVPDNTPIEGWPVGYAGQSLEAVQQKKEPDKDRHAIVVDPAGHKVYEFNQMQKTPSMASGLYCYVRSEVEQASPRRLDVGRCSGTADLSSYCSPR